jgi:hypothetical protein
VHHTHLYPGARLTALDEPPFAAGATQDVVLEFSDGSGSTGLCRRLSDDALTLDVESYRTVAGTELPPKHWLLAPAGERNIWRVAAKWDPSA